MADSYFPSCIIPKGSWAQNSPGTVRFLGGLAKRRTELERFGQIWRRLAKSGVGGGSGAVIPAWLSGGATGTHGGCRPNAGRSAKSFQRRPERRPNRPRISDPRELDRFWVVLRSELDQFGRTGATRYHPILRLNITILDYKFVYVSFYS